MTIVLTVTGVLLEGPTKNGDLLASDTERDSHCLAFTQLQAILCHPRVEEGIHDFPGESALLVLVLRRLSDDHDKLTSLTISTTARQYLATSGKWSDSER